MDSQGDPCLLLSHSRRIKSWVDKMQEDLVTLAKTASGVTQLVDVSKTHQRNCSSLASSRTVLFFEVVPLYYRGPGRETEACGALRSYEHESIAVGEASHRTLPSMGILTTGPAPMPCTMHCHLTASLFTVCLTVSNTAWVQVLQPLKYPHIFIPR